ncbi:MAG: hypothetical protein K9H62_06640 [Bacteroidales bacterium]|nr:hypothetical protein [Bacteroidales bacterium]
MNRISFIIILIITFLLKPLLGQNDSIPTSKLSLNIENFNFLKNAEYFNPIVDGYTDLGYFVAPTIAYRPAKKIKLEVGVHLLKYSGKDKFTKVLPLYSAVYMPNEKFEMRMGTLHGGLAHGLIEPLYFADLHWRENVENGVQFLFQNGFITSDLWINWEDFMENSSDDQERFSLGFSGKINPFRKSDKIKISLPVQFLFTHRGGQGNIHEGHVESLTNSAAGIVFEMPTQSPIISSIKLENYCLSYVDNSPSKQHDFSKGFGWLSGLGLANKHFSLSFNYWYGYHFMSSKGHPMFQSVSERIDGYTSPGRKLISSEFGYFMTIYNGVKLQSGIQYFYDPQRKDFDYSYSLFLIVSLSEIKIK